jgi:sugar lactone lactonase YvrE
MLVMGRVAVASWVVISASNAGAQAATAPVNDRPNPYQTIEGWAKMPEGRTWGSTSAVDIDKDGTSIWVAERCGVNNCVGSTLDPILKFDANGNLVAHFGSGLIQSPHGITVDKDGNVWITDCSCTLGGRGVQPAPSEARGSGGSAQTPPAVGHQIYKFSPSGKLLMTLGKAGGGRDTAFFWQPNDVLVAPSGDIFVDEGHSSSATAPARVFKFSKDGKLLKVIGSTAGTELNQPHALAMDSKGRLFVGDRGNNRIQIYNQDLELLDSWSQFSRPSGLFIDKDDNIYVADSESGSVNPAHGGWKRGIRIGSAKTGEVVSFIPDPAVSPPSTSAAEGVAVDAKGNIYGAEVGPKALKKYVKK